MAKILQLDSHVADLIAAGEVVERPASVIKELMENSIDAGATMITVEIKGGGMTYLRVTDNGCGIAPEDAPTAFLRHATSKLRDEKGLEAISTLGFRGEALAAIAAVSRIELLTREAGAAEGTSLSVEGGAVRSTLPAGCPEGSTMIVRDLFYNTPARLKFMKTDRAEGAAISSQVICCALSHPEVSIRYIKDGKEECHTPGDGRMDSCIYSLFGREFSGGLLKAHTSDGSVTATGFVSSPMTARGNRSCQFFFVNGRFVKSKTLQAALEQAYKNTLMTGRFPSCILYITLRHCEVDVNVHPAKTEVKFLNEHQVFDSVYYAALSALENDGGSPEIILSEGTRNIAGRAVPAVPPDSRTYRQPANSAVGTDLVSGRKSAVINSPGGYLDKAPSLPEKTGFFPVHDETKIIYRTKYETTPVKHVASEQMMIEIREMPEKKTHRVVGEALGTYILAEQGDSLWLIDKHAAHERIHFDRLKDNKQAVMSQALLNPVICELGREDTALILDNAEQFEQLGFSVEAFGEAACAVRMIPSVIELNDIESTLGEMAQILRRGGNPDAGMHMDELRHTIACKAAIKAGRRSEQPEQETLVEKVLSGDVRYCPHGRPVAIELTKAMLDRNFKRT